MFCLVRRWSLFFSHYHSAAPLCSWPAHLELQKSQCLQSKMLTWPLKCKPLKPTNCDASLQYQNQGVLGLSRTRKQQSTLVPLRCELIWCSWQPQRWGCWPSKILPLSRAALLPRSPAQIVSLLQVSFHVMTLNPAAQAAMQAELNSIVGRGPLLCLETAWCCRTSMRCAALARGGGGGPTPLPRPQEGARAHVFQLMLPRLRVQVISSSSRKSRSTRLDSTQVLVDLNSESTRVDSSRWSRVQNIKAALNELCVC